MAEDPTLVSVAAYSHAAADYERDHAPRRAEAADRFARRLPTPSRILDAGCGPGRDLARFVAAGHLPLGVDLNPEFVSMARRHGPVRVADLRHLVREFEPGSFDGVWAEASLVHLPRPEAEQVLRDFAVLLRPGGSLVVSVRSVGQDGWVDEPDGRRWYSVWSAAELETATVAAGFAVDDVIEGSYSQLWATRNG